MKIAPLLLVVGCLAVVTGCGTGSAAPEASAATPTPGPTWDSSAASSLGIQQAMAANASPAADAPAADPAVGAAADQPKGAVSCAITNTYLNSSGFKFVVTATAFHAGPGLRDIRLLVGIYQAGVRVQSAVIDVDNVPPGVEARDTEDVDSGSADGNVPYSCRVDAGGFLN